MGDGVGLDPAAQCGDVGAGLQLDAQPQFGVELVADQAGAGAGDTAVAADLVGDRVGDGRADEVGVAGAGLLLELQVPHSLPRTAAMVTDTTDQALPDDVRPALPTADDLAEVVRHVRSNPATPTQLGSPPRRRQHQRGARGDARR